MDETTTPPGYVTSGEEALKRAESTEAALLAAGDEALAEFLEKMTDATVNGNITRAGALAYWRTALSRQLAHPAFSEVREDLLAELENGDLDDDAYAAAEMAIETAHNLDATPDERRELIEGLFAHPKPSLVASLSERLDAWLRKRLSRLLLKRIRELGPDDLTRADLIGREFDIPEEPGRGSSVLESDWSEDDRPGEINWRARMRRDIRTAYTAIFGRQMQRQIERYGFASKGWVTRHDDRVRPAHVHADGQTVGIYASFEVGGFQLRFPGDPLAPAGLVINCRCVMIAAGPRAF